MVLLNVETPAANVYQSMIHIIRHNLYSTRQRQIFANTSEVMVRYSHTEKSMDFVTTNQNEGENIVSWSHWKQIGRDLFVNFIFTDICSQAASLLAHLHSVIIFAFARIRRYANQGREDTKFHQMLIKSPRVYFMEILPSVQKEQNQTRHFWH